MSNNEPPRGKSVTHQDIARQCGVARSTVSMALQGDPAIKEETREYIRQVALELGYNPAVQEAARRLSLRQYGQTTTNYVIAVLLTPSAQAIPYYARIFSSIWQAANARGYSLVTTYFKEGMERDHPALRCPPVLARGEVDGLILMPDVKYVLVLPYLQAAATDPILGKHPTVGMLPLLGIPSIGPDYLQVGELIGAHLLELGHRHLLAYRYPSETRALELRFEGITTAYQDRGLSVETHLHPFALGDAMAEPTSISHYLAEHAATPAQANRHPLTTYLRRHPEITAVVCINDTQAINATCILKRAGYHIPDDISVIGCDDTEAMPDEYMNNRLTTIHLPLEEMGRMAANLVIALSRGETADESVITLPVTLMPRATTGPARR